jgi:CheY-like chemotaxis protein
MAPDQLLRGFVLLVVEDDAETLKAETTLLSDVLGCDVLSASSGADALRMIDSGAHVDLVFSDVVMPEIDGLMLACEVRQRLPDVPVVLGTGFPGVLDSAAESGAVALIKPFSLERLAAVFTERLRVKPAHVG